MRCTSAPAATQLRPRVGKYLMHSENKPQPLFHKQNPISLHVYVQAQTLRSLIVTQTDRQGNLSPLRSASDVNIHIHICLPAKYSALQS